MSDNKKILLVIIISIILLVFGEIVLRYTEKDYSNKLKIETWNRRIAEFEKEEIKNNKRDTIYQDEELLFIAENSGIVGQAFLGEKDVSEEYSPVEKFIQVVRSELRYWKDVKIFDEYGKEYLPKHFFEGDEATTYLFDTLKNENYRIKFISHFNDEFEKEVSLTKNLKIEFPSGLKNYYKEEKFSKFSITDFEKGDTLQILYEHFGCFSFDHQLIEYIFLDSETEVRVSDRRSDWKELQITSPIDSLEKLILQGRKFDGITGCTNYDYYVFRNKKEKTISIIEDGSCRWNGIKILLKDEE